MEKYGHILCVCGVRYENVVFNTNSDSYSLATCLFNLFVVCVRFCVVVVVVVFTLLVFVCRLKINCPFSLPLALCCSSVECRLDEQFIMIFTTHENITFYVVWRLHTHFCTIEHFCQMQSVELVGCYFFRILLSTRRVV